MYRILPIGLICLASQLAWADEASTMPTDMVDQDKDYSYLTTLPPKADDAKQNRCAEMAHRMQELKGRPQQRYAVSQQYEAECQR